MQIFDDGKLLDLVEENFALTDGAGDHHAGQAGHGHFVNALGEILSLADGCIAVDLGGPDNCASPNDGQCDPDCSSQAYPNL